MVCDKITGKKKTRARIVAIAKDAGYLISVDDLKQAQAEVSDEELEAAAGGTWGVLMFGGFMLGAKLVSAKGICRQEGQ